MPSSPRGAIERFSIRALLIVPGALAFIGCVADKATVAEPPPTCAKAGDTCTFSPGKLGLCVESSTGSPPLVCQSQH